MKRECPKWKKGKPLNNFNNEKCVYSGNKKSFGYCFKANHVENECYLKQAYEEERQKGKKRYGNNNKNLNWTGNRRNDAPTNSQQINKRHPNKTNNKTNKSRE